MSAFFQEAVETASLDEIRSLQTDRLKKIVRHVYENNEVSRRRMEQRGVGPDDIRSVEDVRKLPLMDKELLRENYPARLSCRPAG